MRNELIGAIAATNPGRAERLARALTADYHKAVALASVAREVSAADPDRAVRLIDDAERHAEAASREGNVTLLTLQMEIVKRLTQG